MTAFGETFNYTCEILITTAHKQRAPLNNQLEVIVHAALQKALNSPTTPYYVVSTTVSKRERV